MWHEHLWPYNGMISKNGLGRTVGFVVGKLDGYMTCTQKHILDKVVRFWVYYHKNTAQLALGHLKEHVSKV